MVVKLPSYKSLKKTKSKPMRDILMSWAVHSNFKHLTTHHNSCACVLDIFMFSEFITSSVVLSFVETCNLSKLTQTRLHKVQWNFSQKELMTHPMTSCVNWTCHDDLASPQHLYNFTQLLQPLIVGCRQFTTWTEIRILSIRSKLTHSLQGTMSYWIQLSVTY